MIGPVTVTHSGMEVEHTYDLRGRLVTISEARLGPFDFGYDAAGRIASLIRPNGTNTATTYDDAGRILAVSTVGVLGTVIHEILTTYESRGLPETQTDHEGTHLYVHDIAGRLIEADHPNGATFADESYTYDAADRRTSSASDPPSEVSHDDGDRLVRDAQYIYSYDDEGRRVARTHRVTGAITRYRYNALDQLVSLEEAGEVWSFVYSARDLRVLVKAEVDGFETYGEAFVYDHQGTVRATYDTRGTLTASYLAGPRFGEVLAQVDAVGPLFALRDRLGTTVGWLDDHTVVSPLTVRNAYGVRAAPASVEPFGYTGHTEDPTGLAWGRGRVLAPEAGSWLSEDPVFTEARYSYGGSAPLSNVDPTGTALLIEYGTHDGRIMGVIQVERQASLTVLQRLHEAGWRIFKVTEGFIH
jgi:RHS repeat-associated protein